MAKCTQCKGTGQLNALVSAHDDEKELVDCNKCSGRGTINYMSAEDEADYHADYW